VEREDFALFEERDCPLGVLLGLRLFFLAALFIDGGEALELEGGSLRPEQALSGLDVGAHGVVDSGHHLASQEALPDQAVERHLILGEKLRDRSGLVPELGGPDRFVRLLGASAGAVGRRRLGLRLGPEGGERAPPGAGLVLAGRAVPRRPPAGGGAPGAARAALRS